MMIVDAFAQSSRAHGWPVHSFYGSRSKSAASDERKLFGMIDSLRRIVLSPPAMSERFHALFLDQGRALVGQTSLGFGSMCGVHLRFRELFAYALGVGADSMIIAHNHPSGDCRPSRSDVEATKRLASVANALEIELIDHLIFTQDAVFSMRGGSEL